MRAVVQRSGSAAVSVDGTVCGEIPCGLVAYVGFRDGDTEQDLTYVAEKIVNLRVFEDAEGRMNRSLIDLQNSEHSSAGVLVISQFTVYGDVRNGRRPSYNHAAAPERAVVLYDRFVALVKHGAKNVASGVFQAKMQVQYVNEGPVTILIDSEKRF